MKNFFLALEIQIGNQSNCLPSVCFPYNYWWIMIIWDAYNDKLSFIDFHSNINFPLNMSYCFKLFASHHASSINQTKTMICERKILANETMWLWTQIYKFMEHCDDAHIWHLVVKNPQISCLNPTLFSETVSYVNTESSNNPSKWQESTTFYVRTKTFQKSQANNNIFWHEPFCCCFFRLF